MSVAYLIVTAVIAVIVPVAALILILVGAVMGWLSRGPDRWIWLGGALLGGIIVAVMLFGFVNAQLS